MLFKKKIFNRIFNIIYLVYNLESIIITFNITVFLEAYLPS